MRTQSLLALFNFILAGHLALAAWLDPDDVPDRCSSACDSVVSIAQDCDRHNDNDTSEFDCICDSDQAETIIPRCEACIAQYRTNNPQDEDHGGNADTTDTGDGDDGDDGDGNDDADPHDNDVYDILTSCGFDTTTYAAASSAPSATSSSSARSSSAAHRSSSSPGHSSSEPSPSPTPNHSSSPSSHSSSASASGYITTSGVYHPPAFLSESSSPSVTVSNSVSVSVSVSPSLIYVPPPSSPGHISFSSEPLSGFATSASLASSTPPPGLVAAASTAVRESSPLTTSVSSTATTITRNSFEVPT